MNSRRCPANAMKHGLRSGHVLLPGDNLAEFRKLRHGLFHLLQPRSIVEARHVETLAANEWRVARCRLEQAWFKEQLGVAMGGHPDASGYLCSPDLHRLHHRGTDCQREERLLEKSMSEARTALTLLQKQRTENLTPGAAAALEPYEVFLAEGEPAVWEEQDEPAPEDAVGMEASGEEPSGEHPETLSTPSADGENSIGPKRTQGTPPRRIPKPWNRRQRRAAVRRGAGR